MQIEISDLKYEQRKFRLGPLSFSISKGNILGIGGPNGSGKTTFLRVLLGLLRPLSGNVQIDGMDISTMKRRDVARKIAYLPQNLFAPLSLSVQDVLLASQYSVSEKPSLLDKLLTEYSIADLKNRDFNSLSGGEKRIVMLAGAISQGSEIIVMDEPDTFLDIDKELFLYDKIRELSDAGRTMIIVFHDLNKLLRLCDTVLLLKNGQQAAFGDRKDVLRPDVLEKIFRARFRQMDIDGTQSLVARSWQD